MNYWLFQGNPKYFDFKLAVERGVLNNWGVTHLINDVEIGDNAVFWLSGTNRGVAGIGKIITRPTTDFNPPDDFCWTEEGRKKNNNATSNKQRTFVKIELTTDTKYFVNPISFFDIAKEIKLPVGRGYQNTNYRIEPIHYQKISELFKL